MQFWNPQLECPSLTSYSSHSENLTSAFIASQLQFDSDRNEWGVNVDVDGAGVAFHECTIAHSMPTSLAGVVRHCSGVATISTCPRNFTDEAIVSLCHSYTALIYEVNTPYRNVHCAICNNAALDKLICLNLGPFGRFNWQTNFNSFSFAVLVRTTVIGPKLDLSKNWMPGNPNF